MRLRCRIDRIRAAIEPPEMLAFPGRLCDKSSCLIEVCLPIFQQPEGLSKVFHLTLRINRREAHAPFHNEILQKICDGPAAGAFPSDPWQDRDACVRRWLIDLLDNKLSTSQ